MARSHHQQTPFFKGYKVSFLPREICPIPLFKIPKNMVLTIIRLRLGSQIQA